MKIFALVALLLLCCYFVAGEQQHGLALRGHALPRSPIRRLTQGTSPAACDRPEPVTNVNVDDVVNHTASDGDEWDFSQRIVDKSWLQAFAALDCDADVLYFAAFGIGDQSALNVVVSFSEGVVVNKPLVLQQLFGIEVSGAEAEVSLATYSDCQTVVVSLANDSISIPLDLSCQPTCPCQDTNSGAVFGDPHLKTWNGDIFNFDGGCDLIFLKNRAFASGTGLEIHIRTTIRRDWSYISAAALKIGDDVLEVQSGGTYYLNGVEGAELVPSSLAGFPITMKAHGQKRHMFKVALENECEVIIKVYNEFLAVSVNNAGIDFEHSVGMMGSYRTGRRLARDGETEIDDPTLFGFEWQVREGDPVLFQKPEGPQYPQACDMPETDSTATGRNRRLSEDGMVSLEDAEKACQSWPDEGREACLYDVMSTGDLAMAEAGAF